MDLSYIIMAWRKVDHVSHAGAWPWAAYSQVHMTSLAVAACLLISFLFYASERGRSVVERVRSDEHKKRVWESEGYNRLEASLKISSAAGLGARP
jgi:hypothetical protein